jgi:hypothetical protein
VVENFFLQPFYDLLLRAQPSLQYNVPIQLILSRKSPWIFPGGLRDFCVLPSQFIISLAAIIASNFKKQLSFFNIDSR